MNKQENDLNTNILITAAKTKNQSNRTLFAVTVTIIAGIVVLFFLPKEQIAQSESTLHKLGVELESKKLPAQSTTNVVPNLIVDFESNIKPKLKSIVSGKTIFSKRASELILSLDKDFSHYSRLPNLQAIEAELDQALSLIREVDEVILTHLDRISLAYEEINYRVYEHELSSLEKLSPSDPRMNLLRERSLLVKNMAAAKKEARVARIQNNIELELVALKKMKSAGFADQTKEKRIEDLQLTIKVKNYNRLSRQARDYRDNRNYTQALVTIKAAEKLVPQRADLDDLRIEIDALYRMEQVAMFNEQAKKRARQDKWSEAETYYSKALELQQTNTEALTGRELSGQILSYIAIFRDFLKRPFRLTDPTVAAYSEGVLNGASRISSRSPLLESLRAEVIIVLDDLKKPRELKIVSNGKTTIEVKGVGFIKPTINKTIRLKPGEYILHANCRGHYVNLLNIKVPVNGDTKPLRIICGKRI
jgi:tetratricopeptide (TPR) repeat protein